MVYNIDRLSLFNKNEYRNNAFIGLMDAISNRRIIQQLRLELFKAIDIQPKNLIHMNLLNSNIMNETYFYILNSSEEILDLLEDQVKIYNRYFMPTTQGLRTNVRDLFLPEEEELFLWEQHYLKWIRKFISDDTRLRVDPTGYYQKLYEFIIMDMTYGDVYDTIHIVE